MTPASGYRNPEEAGTRYDVRVQYLMTGVDGKEYGPVDVQTLKAWAGEGRVAPHTTLRDFNSGQTMVASSVPGLFSDSPNVPPIGAGYPRSGVPAGSAVNRSSDEGGGAFAGVVIRSILGAVLFFVLHGIGLIVAGSGLITAFQLKSNGSKWGVPALAISALSVVAIGIGWALRMSGAHA